MGRVFREFKQPPCYISSLNPMHAMTQTYDSITSKFHRATSKLYTELLDY